MAGVEDMLKREVGFSKQERIRLKEWMNKLSYRQSNPIWKKNINFYLRVMSEMIK